MIGRFLRRCFSSANTISSVKQIPPPTSTVPDVTTFLSRLRRNCDSYAPKIGSWDSLFQANGKTLERLGIPVKPRRWILLWTEKFRQGVEPYYIRPSRKDKRPKKTTRKAFKHL